MTVERRARIAALNDQLRKTHQKGRIMITSGVTALGTAANLAALASIATFDAFNEDNDPYGEHDFGSLEVHGQRLFWKIDYYDNSLTAAGDPADLNCTHVLTVMLAEEY